MKKLVLLVLSLVTLGLQAETWKTITDANWLYGPKLKPQDLFGKVVMVYCWSSENDRSQAILKNVENIHKAFKTKPCVIMGSYIGHDKEGAKKYLTSAKITFPNYKSVKLDNQMGQFKAGQFVVLSHRGKIVPINGGEKGATQALVESIGNVGRPPTLLGDYVFDRKSPYRSLEKKFALGQNIRSLTKQLEKDVKSGQSKAASKMQKEKAEEASTLLTTIASEKEAIQGEITAVAGYDAAEAVKLIKLYMKSFPDEAKEYKEKIPELNAKAKEQKAARIAAEKAAKNHKPAAVEEKKTEEKAEAKDAKDKDAKTPAAEEKKAGEKKAKGK